jgi:DNA-binding MarR family transcriptional regulator
MSIESAQNMSAEARFARQAVQLQRVLFKLLQPPSEHVFPELALSFREISLLHTLGTRSEMMMTELASILHLPLSTVTRMVDRLENVELVERARSEQDRRLVLVKKSEKAMLLYAGFEKMQLELARRILAPLSHGEREILLELMMKLAAV